MMSPQILSSGVLGDINGFQNVHKPRCDAQELVPVARRHNCVL
jgi:hypothetical protein